jgi:hypothetical protein
VTVHIDRLDQRDRDLSARADADFDLADDLIADGYPRDGERLRRRAHMLCRKAWAALLDEIRARLPVSAVVGKRVALKKAGREWKGLSPFKSEKSPSFFVNDIKGFYHCFASGEHGDIFTFVMKTEGLTFPEAIERLAAEAGVQLPKEARP